MSTPPTPAPCRSWRSPITTDALVADTVRLAFPAFSRDGVTTWLEGRPAEKGRNALVRLQADGGTCDVLPPPWNVRSRVHEYGGNPYVVEGDDTWFVSFADQRLFHVRPGAEPRALVADGTGWRFADLTLDLARRRLLAVGEKHTAGEREPSSAVVAIGLDDGRVTSLVEGADFHASPRLSPDGRWLAWLAWNHPHMPWDAAALFVARLDVGGRPGEARHVAGDARASVFQPSWTPSGDLLFAWEPQGFWRLHRAQLNEDGGAVITPVGQVDAVSGVHPEEELGLPLWQLGMATWGLLDDHTILTAATRAGLWRLVRIDLRDGRVTGIATPLTSISHVAAREGRALILGGSSDSGTRLASWEAATGTLSTLRQSSSLVLAAELIAVAQPVTFPTSDGDHAHGFFYPPRNPAFVPLPGERPPLMVTAHGGPTAATSGALNAGVQYWTSRGFAVLDVNYRGSTGYGRAFRDRLANHWGIYDVDDCVAGAQHLVARGLVDGNRLVIRGGSAGGYTTLAALAFRRVFAAGASHYGVGDLGALARDTHKFESRYLDGLVGRWPADEALYQARSPLAHADDLSCPVIFLQGLEDKIVPPEQAEAMVAALDRKGVPVAYLAFEGEQHGFRKADTIKRALEAELYFYGRVLGFQPAEAIPAIPIAHLPPDPR